ncbi:MAG: peptidoglycan recognition family protein [Phycisphaerales bacterium]|nr:peptidoglycan recognition family protein [Phycisphaerales bacterium]
MTQFSATHSAPQSPAISRRTKAVWLALGGSMTLVAGLMLVLEGGPSPRAQGLALPAAAATTNPTSLEVIFHTKAPIQKGAWHGIVIHHSGSTRGTPASIEREHLAQNLTGLGYHFVIGNGRGIADGEVHVAYRWNEQLPGAHVAGPDADRLNRSTIGICLIGDGDTKGFTDAQVRRLAELCATLCRELGLPQDAVMLHSDVAGTTDPGRLFPEAAFRQQLALLMQ